MKKSLHLQYQPISRTKCILGNKGKLLSKYSPVDNSQTYYYKYCSINSINSKSLKRTSGEQEGVVMWISTTNCFLSYAIYLNKRSKKHLLTLIEEEGASDIREKG